MTAKDSGVSDTADVVVERRFDLTTNITPTGLESTLTGWVNTPAMPH
jgi:hypothetical protein